MNMNLFDKFDRNLPKARDYQQQAANRIIRQLDESGNALCILATGLGKTFIAGLLAKFYSKRIILTSPRQRINGQNKRSLEKITGEDVGVEQSELWCDSESRLIVACNPTLLSQGRISRFNLGRGDVVIFDECHLMGAGGVDLANSLRNKEVKIVGLTATPNVKRPGWSPVSVFGEPCVEFDLRWGIEQGYLSPVRAKRITLQKVSYEKARRAHGFDAEEIESILSQESVMQERAACVDKVMSELGEGHHHIAIESSIRSADLLALHLERHGRKVGVVHSNKRREDRAETLQMFSDGELEIIVSVAALREGYDEPIASCLHVLCPFGNVTPYCQAVGRITRILPDVIEDGMSAAARRKAIAASAKPYAMIVDYQDNTRCHSLINACDLTVPRKPRKRRPEVHDEKPIDILEIDQAIKDQEKLLAEQAHLDRMAERERRKEMLAEVGVEVAEDDPFIGGRTGTSRRREARVLWGNWSGKSMKGIPIRLAPKPFLIWWQQKLPRDRRHEWIHNAINKRLCR